ncbi:MAG: NADPH-dependent glutamate synthase [Candidatus Korobacteraceae bacterium]
MSNTTQTKTSHNPLPNKERSKLPRQRVPEQLAQIRAHNFQEVNLGFPAETARQESLRCIECPKPGCIEKCPVSVDVKAVIDLILAEDYMGAASKVREDNALPAITGRVCPVEDQCESGCVLGKKGEPVGIAYLERFVADWERETGHCGIPKSAPPTGKKVGIVGSGPAALACAGDLIQMGHQVHVFEALHELGGVLVYGIPEFRLPKEIVRHEIDVLRRRGVEFETNVVVGKTVTIDELTNDEGYDALFIATGAGLPRFLNVPGEHFNGVYSANEFLTRVNLMRAYRFPEFDEPIYPCKDRDVIVVGGGNTAMDAIRSALRLGAKTASIYYRRTEKEMPARVEEVHHAKDEGVHFEMLVNPVEFLADEKGNLTAVKCIRQELGEPDDSGRRSPVPIKGSEFVTPCSVAIIAAWTSANPLIQSTTPGLATTKRGYIQADDSLATSKPGVFAGGDIVTGGATVILAMGAGRKAATSIDEYLKAAISN